MSDKYGYSPRYTVRQKPSILGERFPQWCIWDTERDQIVGEWVGGVGKAQAFPQSLVTQLGNLNRADRIQWEEQGGEEKLVAVTGRKDLNNGTELSHELQGQLENYMRENGITESEGGTD